MRVLYRILALLPQDRSYSIRSPTNVEQMRVTEGTSGPATVKDAALCIPRIESLESLWTAEFRDSFCGQQLMSDWWFTFNVLIVFKWLDYIKHQVEYYCWKISCLLHSYDVRSAVPLEKVEGQFCHFFSQHCTLCHFLICLLICTNSSCPLS